MIVFNLWIIDFIFYYFNINYHSLLQLNSLWSVWIQMYMFYLRSSAKFTKHANKNLFQVNLVWISLQFKLLYIPAREVSNPNCNRCQRVAWGVFAMPRHASVPDQHRPLPNPAREIWTFYLPRLRRLPAHWDHHW